MLKIINDGWIWPAHPPPAQTFAVSGARHFAAKIADGRPRALEFVQRLLDAPIPHIALKNPISVISSKIRKYQIISLLRSSGHGETKATCLWLNNLPTTNRQTLSMAANPRSECPRSRPLEERSGHFRNS